MSITQEDVKHIAALSRLGLTNKEIERAAKDISSILDHFALIQLSKTATFPPYHNCLQIL